jgi:hypothetical protein
MKRYILSLVGLLVMTFGFASIEARHHHFGTGFGLGIATGALASSAFINPYYYGYEPYYQYRYMAPYYDYYTPIYYSPSYYYWY